MVLKINLGNITVDMQKSFAYIQQHIYGAFSDFKNNQVTFIFHSSAYS